MKIIVIIGIVILLLFICSFLFFKKSEITQQKANNQTQLINKIKTDTGLVISYGFKIIKFEEDDSFDPSWIAKIAIPKEKMVNFKKKVIAKKGDNITSIGGNRLSASAKWWKPQNPIISKFYVCNSQSTLIYIVISKDKDGEFVYIECMTN